MHKRRIVFAAMVATLGLGLSACGGDEEGSATAQDPPASSSASAPASESESADSEDGDDSGDGAASDEETTEPGTELAVGDRAVLPFEYTSDKKGTIAITVTAIEEGAESDMAAFGDKAKGMKPYFIKMKVENVDGADLSYATLKLNGVLEGGSGTGVVLIGDIPGKCDNEGADNEFTTAGASYETCSLTATTGAPVVGAQFDEGDAYSDNPVVWAS
ncbi:hypothetical protein [Prauserella cavernicola]|uniref:DUF4352 domain-containing protein n=1 Tax=Prauserella cavernicola TaxID=2800127 RepID=A0A934QWG4_9PSEU|nr:hypothetical protein [Prauserella cavernicola]MBK1787427.1 hypothetical protein [Prauserella cavernicola]